MTLSGNYVSQARAICNSIYKNISSTSVNRLYFGNVTSYINSYSMMAVLSNNKQICVGISGTSDGVYYWKSTIDNDDVYAIPERWNESPIGCYYNP